MVDAPGSIGSEEPRRKFVNTFANGVYMDTEIDDELVCNLLRLDAFETLQRRPPTLPFIGTLLETSEEHFREDAVLG